MVVYELKLVPPAWMAYVQPVCLEDAWGPVIVVPVSLTKVWPPCTWLVLRGQRVLQKAKLRGCVGLRLGAEAGVLLWLSTRGWDGARVPWLWVRLQYGLPLPADFRCRATQPCGWGLSNKRSSGI